MLFRVKFVRALALILALNLLCFNSFSSQWNIHSIVVFGSGESDNGRSFALYKFPVMPPYWHGRFSNGPAWSEYLAYNLKLIPNPELHPNYNKKKFFLDYSYYNATATKKYNTDPNYLMTLDAEINQYANNKHRFPLNTLAVLYIGQNDLFNSNCVADPLSCLQDVTNAEKNGLMRLCSMNLRHFLIITPGDQADIPYYIRFYNYDTRQRLLQIEGNYASSFADLKHIVETQCHKSKVIVFDLLRYERTWIQTFNQPAHIPCYWNVDKAGNLIYNKQIGPVCSEPNKYYYFDSFYASAAANKLMGSAVYNTILKNKLAAPPAKYWWQNLL